MFNLSGPQISVSYLYLDGSGQLGCSESRAGVSFVLLDQISIVYLPQTHQLVGRDKCRPWS